MTQSLGHPCEFYLAGKQKYTDYRPKYNMMSYRTFPGESHPRVATVGFDEGGAGIRSCDRPPSIETLHGKQGTG